MGKNRVCMIVVLTIFLLLSLVACGQNDRIDSGTIVYVPEEVKFSSPLTRTESACASGEAVYLLGAVRDSRTYEETVTLVRVPLEGGKGDALSAFQPFQPELDEEIEYDSIGGTIRPGKDGTLWLTESVYYQRFDLPEDFDPETDGEEKYQYISDSGSFPVLRQLDSEGNELFSFNGSGLREALGIEWISDLYSDGAGTIFANSDVGLYDPFPASSMLDPPPSPPTGLPPGPLSGPSPSPSPGYHQSVSVSPSTVTGNLKCTHFTCRPSGRGCSKISTLSRIFW